MPSDLSHNETSMSAAELHEAGDRAAFAGDYQTANALRTLEGNARGGEVMRQWAYEHLAATEAEVRAHARWLALGWGASENALYEQAMRVYRDAARTD